MFNIGSGEIAVIAVVALLLLGPQRLPELARGIGKFVREFRRQTDEVRGVVEREFYRMDKDLSLDDEPVRIRPPAAAPVAIGVQDEPEAALPAPVDPVRSQLTAGLEKEPPAPAPVEASIAPSTPASAPAQAQATGMVPDPERK